MPEHFIFFTTAQKFVIVQGYKKIILVTGILFFLFGGGRGMSWSLKSSFSKFLPNAPYPIYSFRAFFYIPYNILMAVLYWKLGAGYVNWWTSQEFNIWTILWVLNCAPEDNSCVCWPSRGLSSCAVRRGCSPCISSWRKVGAIISQ